MTSTDTDRSQPRTADRAELLRRARELVPLVEERAAEAERQRQVHDDTIDRVRAAGLLDLLVPAALGGCETDTRTAFEVIETIARADGGTGWTSMILNGSLIAAWLDPEVGARITAPGDFVLAGMFGPLGRAIPEGDGFRVTGRWPFNSGCPHATWMLGGVFVMEGDRPAERAPGIPDYRFALFPVADAEIHDTWHVSGLRATASHDVSTENTLVPAELTPVPMLDRPRHDGPLWRHSFFALLTSLIAAVPLGIARRALDEATELCRTKSRQPGTVLLDDSAVQLTLLRAEANLRAARAYLLDALGRAYETAVAGDLVSPDQRVDVRLAGSQAARTAVEVVDDCFRLGGGGALYEHSVLQRCWRDAHAGTHHVFFGDEHLREVGGILFGTADFSMFV